MNNYVTLVGKYKDGYVNIERTSGKVDSIPINRACNYENVLVIGEYHSKNDNGKVKLYVDVITIEEIERSDNFNDVFLDGRLCKAPVYRMTPQGREITDILLAVGGNYIPCVAWGQNARELKNMAVGDSLRVAGRIQSREYSKDGESKTAYEVSINIFEK